MARPFVLKVATLCFPVDAFGACKMVMNGIFPRVLCLERLQFLARHAIAEMFSLFCRPVVSGMGVTGMVPGSGGVVVGRQHGIGSIGIHRCCLLGSVEGVGVMREKRR